MSELYKILGVTKKASARRITKAFRALAMKHHPDRNLGDDEAAEQFKRIKQAYDILGDDAKRKRYDETGEFQSGPDNSEGQILAVIGQLFGQVMHTLHTKGGDFKSETTSSTW